MAFGCIFLYSQSIPDQLADEARLASSSDVLYQPQTEERLNVPQRSPVLEFSLSLLALPLLLIVISVCLRQWRRTSFENGQMANIIPCSDCVIAITVDI